VWHEAQAKETSLSDFSAAFGTIAVRKDLTGLTSERG